MNWEERCKKGNITYAYDETENKLTLKRNWESAEVKVSHDLGITYARYLHTSGYELLRISLEFVEDYAREWGCSLLSVAGINVWNSHMARFQYTNVSKEAAWRTFHSETEWYRNIGKSSFRHILKKCTAVEEALKKVKEKDPTMTFTLCGKWLSIQNIKFYFRGVNGAFQIEYHNKNLEIHYAGKTYPGHQKDLIASSIESIFNFIEKTTRLKNEFNPPKDYFTRYLKVSIGVNLLATSIINSIHENLLSRHNWIDIETYCANQLENREKFKFKKMDYSSVFFIHLWDQIYYIDKKQMVTPYEPSQIEEVIIRFVTEVNDDYQRQLKSELQTQFA